MLDVYPSYQKPPMWAPCDSGVVANNCVEMGLSFKHLRGLWIWPGGNWPDISGQRIDGTFSGDAVNLVPGGVEVGGTDDWVSFGDVYKDITTEFTIFIIFKPNAITGYPVLFGKWVSGVNQQFKLGSSLNGNGIPFIDVGNTAGGEDNYRVASTVVPVDTRTSVTGVFKSSITLDIYLNGVNDNGALTGTIPANLKQCTADVRFGAQGDDSNDYSGMAECIILFDKAFTPAQVKTLSTDPYGSVRSIPWWEGAYAEAAPPPDFIPQIMMF